MAIRDRLARLVQRVQHRIKKPVYPTTRRPLRELEEFCSYLAARELMPSTVIDVGACYGTQELLQGYPEAYHILIEPVPALEDRLKALTTRYLGEYHMTALSDAPGERAMYIPDGAIPESKFAHESDAPTQMVPVETLDGLFNDRDLERPVLLKTECHWHGLQVLKGGERVLKQIDVAIVEAMMFRQHPNHDAPLFGDIVCWMREQGFAVFDIISYQTRPYDDALGNVDLVFVREDGPLRRHHRWS